MTLNDSRLFFRVYLVAFGVLLCVTVFVLSLTN